MEVTVSNKDFLQQSPIDVVIESKVAVYDTKDSQPLVLFVEDPCRNTALIN